VKKIVTPNNHGFTLLEVLMVVAILGILSAIGIAAYKGYIEATKVAAAKMQIRELSIALNDYALDYGAYPDSLAEIGNANLLDPWGNPYQYLKFPNLVSGASVLGSEIYSSFSAGYSFMYASYNNSESDGYSSGYGEYNGSYEGYNSESGGYSGSYQEQGGGGDPSGGNSDNGSSGQSYMGQARKDRNLVPINSHFDLYSKGKDGQSRPPLTVPVSQDDIIYANDGAYIGLAKDY